MLVYRKAVANLDKAEMLHTIKATIDDEEEAIP
jgi:hypothetical protein